MRIVAGAAAMLAACALGGCGFTPLYATPGLSTNLSSIDVRAPDGRVAYLIRESLDDDLAKDKGDAPLWRLDFQVAQSRSPRGLTISDYAQRYQVGLTVTYTLTNISSGQVVHAGRVVSEVSYDAANAPYAGIAARQDSQQRAASDAARKMEIELAAWMAANTAKTP
jgi:LPS-assembly lipoprotein